MKRIIICGAGEVGRHAAEVLSAIKHNVVVIDLNGKRLEEIEEHMNIGALKGSSSHPEVLEEAGVKECDLLVAATDKDEVNLLTASLAKRMGCKEVVARVHHHSYFKTENFDYFAQFGIDHLICPEQLTSLAITAAIADPGVMEIQRFANSQLEMHRHLVKKGSRSIGVKLRELGFPSDLRVAVVERDGGYFVPVGDTVFQDGDLVTIVGQAESFQSVQKLFTKQKDNNQVAVMGGTSMAEWLVQDLHRRNFSIRLFETNRVRAIELSELYPYITVINADPTDPNEFKAEHLERTAAFITTTEEDERNILGAIQAKKFGVRTSAAVVNAPNFLSLLENVGIDLPYSPRIVAAESLLHIVHAEKVRKLATLAKDVVDLIEVGPVSGGTEIDKPLNEMRFPAGSFIAAIQRSKQVIVPTAEDKVEIGDMLIIIGPLIAKRDYLKMFVS